MGLNRAGVWLNQWPEIAIAAFVSDFGLLRRKKKNPGHKNGAGTEN